MTLCLGEGSTTSDPFVRLFADDLSRRFPTAAAEFLALVWDVALLLGESYPPPAESIPATASAAALASVL